MLVFRVKIGVLIGIRYMFGFIVRHTPHFVFVHRFAIGMAGATHPALRAPLSERGWRGCDLLLIKTMRQPIPSRRGVAVGRGVSHCQTPLIWGVSHHQTSSILDVSHCQIGYPMDPVNPWFTYRGSMRSKFKENLFQNYSNLFDFRIDFG